MEALKHENERLRRDNERFVRIIDSGEWGRGRVAELVQAGQVLKQERDQLAQLMGHLRNDYEAVERAKVAQQEELAALKSRMKKKGAANNRMLVKVRFPGRFVTANFGDCEKVYTGRSNGLGEGQCVLGCGPVTISGSAQIAACNHGVGQLHICNTGV